MIRHLLWSAAHEFDSSIVAEVQIECALQIHNSCQRYCALQRRVPCRQTKRKLPTSRMADDRASFAIEFIFAGVLADKTIATENVLKTPGPPSAGVSDAAIFEIKR